jgi:hypothetical protein
VARELIAYKFLGLGRIGRFTGFRWEEDAWVETEAADACRAGIHACRVRDLPIWLDDELWEIELAGDVLVADRKVVATRGRLVGRIERWTPELMRDFGRFCAQRTRERVGFLPFLGGFVFDVDRFVAQNRIAIAGFAAARAAELRDGPAAYDAERLVQASWLADRLELEITASFSARG